MKLLRALALGLATAGAVAPASAGCSSTPPAGAAPARSCQLVVWHKPASTQSHVEIVGDWDGWKRPGTIPEARDDGWRAASFDLTPGEHQYAVVEDGVWLTDKNVPTTAFHEGREVTFATIPNCEVPAVRVDGVEVREGHAVVTATFLASRGGAALDPSSVRAVSLPTSPEAALAVTAADPSTGTLRLEAPWLARGKYMFSIRAKDARGVEAEEAIATVWVAHEPWDPRDAVVYQIVLDRFRDAKGPLSPPETPSARAGGTLAGVKAAIDLGDIPEGVDTLWLSPLYQNPEGEFAGNDRRMYSSYHGYWPARSRAIDPRLATDGELDAFMRDAHASGLRVLFDVVPNHVHEQHPWVTEHPDWFHQGCVCGQPGCEWGTHVKTCWFAPYLPDLDWTNLDAARAATDEIMWWFDRWGADGLRIDAVPMMPRAATRRIAAAVRAKYEHPGNTPYILGENFTGPGGYQILRYDLGPFGLDGSFNFPLMWTLRAAVAAESAPMSDLDASFRAGQTAWNGSGAVMGLMIGNHDVSRFASVSAGNDSGDPWTPAPQPLDPLVYQKQRLALAAVLTLPGAPVLYYGDEVGLAGRGDPDCRRVMPADADLLPEQIATRQLVNTVGGVRRCSVALRRGALVTLLADRERFVFARIPEAGPLAVVALTRRPTTEVTVPLPDGAPAMLVDRVTGARVTGGQLTVPADAFGVHVYVDAGGACSGFGPASPRDAARTDGG